METIHLERLLRDEAAITKQFREQRPFRYVVIDDFLTPDMAMAILAEYPVVDQSWKSANGLNTRGKWTKTKDLGPVASAFYREINSPEFLVLLGRLTGIKDLLQDPDLSGAGYHQILDGGFLNVHVDFNKLTDSGLDRRLNLIVYLNPDWQERFGGYLELWDMQARTRIENIAPAFNRCVVFETNEVSFHGHPVPLATGGATTRKSLSVYYYTKGRDDIEAAPTHSTLYRNTHGARGAARVFLNGVIHAGRKMLKALR